MGKINFGRVLLGGLVAGMILTIGEYLINDVILAKQMAETYRHLNVPKPGNHFIIAATVVTILLGILLVWLYALIRTRLGPGPKAAVVAAIILWFGIYVYGGVIYGMLFQIPMNLMLIGFAWGFVEYIVAALAGGALYSES
jgi:hypothetical protein